MSPGPGLAHNDCDYVNVCHTVNMPLKPLQGTLTWIGTDSLRLACNPSTRQQFVPHRLFDVNFRQIKYNGGCCTAAFGRGQSM
jgi:hypothetical protein